MNSRSTEAPEQTPRTGADDLSAESTLDSLLAGITDENLHPFIDFGPPVGKEIP